MDRLKLKIKLANYITILAWLMKFKLRASCVPQKIIFLQQTFIIYYLFLDKFCKQTNSLYLFFGPKPQKYVVFLRPAVLFTFWIWPANKKKSSHPCHILFIIFSLNDIEIFFLIFRCCSGCKNACHFSRKLPLKQKKRAPTFFERVRKSNKFDRL